MGLLDKVKSTATQAMAGTAQVTSQVSTQVSAKVEQVQLRKRADDAARQLGYLLVREREGAALDQAEVDRLVGVVQGAEAQIRRAADHPTSEGAARAESGSGGSERASAESNADEAAPAAGGASATGDAGAGRHAGAASD